jgi:hypothetical protein
MRFRTALITVLAPLLIASCDNPFSSSGEIEIRVANESSFAFSDVEVVFPEDSVDYGAIAANGISEYRRVSKAYDYALIIVQVGGEERRIQPIDYVGEPLLQPGRYTYLLNVTIEGHLTLEFQHD